jgi:hypothetical protein
LRKTSPLSGQHGVHFSVTVITGHSEIRGITKKRMLTLKESILILEKFEKEKPKQQIHMYY